MMKRKKSPHVHRKVGISSDGNNTPKHLTLHTSSSSLFSVQGDTHQTITVPSISNLTSTPTTSISVTPSRTAGVSSFVTCDEPTAEDMGDTEPLAPSNMLSNGSMDTLNVSSVSYGGSPQMQGDETDGQSHTPDIHRTRAAIEHVQQKIIRTRELIKDEQTTRDENVNEYLKLAANADRQQLQRIKSVFEKKNQKSAQTIAQLQKKLENYNKRIKDLETHGLSSSHWQPREVLRDMGQGLKDVGANIKEGITGFSGTVMSKPREFAHLIKNRFGSADNISSLEKLPEESSGDDTERNHHGSATFTHSTKYTSDDDSSSITSGSGPVAAAGNFISPQHQPSALQAIATGPESSITPTAVPVVVDVEPILQELREQREESHRLREDIESLKNHLQQQGSCFNQALQEERYRYERLEEQMNDLIELHQNEIENLKQGIADMEEKVQYQSEERLRDVHEVLENCQTRISRMEHQQHQHLQQLVTLDALESSNARAFVVKLINLLLMVLQVVLVLVATVSNIIMPFLQSRIRILTTVVLILTVILVCRQWQEWLEIGQQYVNSYFQR
ncbi:transmembrane and coiled-coil domains protein 2 isoform X1 [Centruroides vittatus]|uniref:transmembrane and coiled-coil domains protein 2 isoform X1 n=2 Tax=Centruroides vittatus TaxID=120091 RepID=UPI003510BA15